MKKIVVCALLATALAFGVGGCSKQEEQKETATEKAGSMVQESTTKTEGMTQQAGQASEEAQPATEGMAQQAGQAVEGMAQQAGQVVEEAKEAVSEQTDAMKEKVEGTMENAPAASEAQQAGEKASDMMKDLPGSTK